MFDASRRPLQIQLNYLYLVTNALNQTESWVYDYNSGKAISHYDLNGQLSDSGEHDLTQPVVLSPRDVHLKFAYSVPSLLGAKTREFRYRLAGIDADWRAGGKQRDESYTSLPPGDYRFQVSVRRPFEDWSAASAPLAVRVLPHFYQTWWWYALIAVGSIAVVILGYRLRLVAFADNMPR